IDLHFVVSNIPDIDDEDRILESSLRKIDAELNPSTPPLIVQHYPSFELVNQVIFTQKRPHTRLAQQYRKLAQQIKLRNPEDPDGALQVLRDLRNQILERPLPFKAAEIEARLSEIQRYHRANGQVLALLGEIRFRQGHIRDANELLELAEACGN